MCPTDTGSESASEMGESPAPKSGETHRVDVSDLRRSSGNEMEDRSSPTRRFGTGTNELDLVRAPIVSSTDVNNYFNTSEDGQEDSDNWNINKKVPRNNLSGRGRGGMMMRPDREHHALSKEQLGTIKAAQAALSSEELLHITRRQAEEPDLIGDGPSRNKGKGIDPLEFGNIQFTSGEEDPEIQRAMYEEHQTRKKALDAQKALRLNTSRDVFSEERHPAQSDAPHVPREGVSAPSARTDTPSIQKRQAVMIDRADRSKSVPRGLIDSMMPSKLMHPDSAVARSLQNGGRMAVDAEENPLEDSSSSSSDSSDSSSDSDSSQTSHRRKKKSRKRKKSKRKINIKPKEPTEYSGEVDFRKFNRFLKETCLYVKDAGFSKKEYILRIAPFMKGKALNFYTQKAEMYEAMWDLKTFYGHLFDYCFPPNYRMNLRDKLEKTTQLPDHSVTQYAHNIQEIFGMLGNVTAGGSNP
jgi:hypothetical protein